MGHFSCAFVSAWHDYTVLSVAADFASAALAAADADVVAVCYFTRSGTWYLLSIVQMRSIMCAFFSLFLHFVRSIRSCHFVWVRVLALFSLFFFYFASYMNVQSTLILLLLICCCLEYFIDGFIYCSLGTPSSLCCGVKLYTQTFFRLFWVICFLRSHVPNILSELNNSSSQHTNTRTRAQTFEYALPFLTIQFSFSIAINLKHFTRTSHSFHNSYLISFHIHCWLTVLCAYFYLVFSSLTFIIVCIIEIRVLLLAYIWNFVSYIPKMCAHHKYTIQLKGAVVFSSRANTKDNWNLCARGDGIQ